MPALAKLGSRVLNLATNLRGWRTRRRLVVIESDDWGAIRMPSRHAWERLLAVGIRVDRSRYDSLDCLENYGDFQALMNVIDAHRDAKDRPATFTFNTVMGNPDFEAIEDDGFERFHHQHLFESYRHYHGEDLESMWRDAMARKLIRPQFHAREHLNSSLWMRDLRAGHKATRLAFEQRFYGLKTQTGSRNQPNYLAAYWADSLKDVKNIEEIIADGAARFAETFGYRSKSFVACNYVWPKELEANLARLGVELIQTQRGHVQPDPARGGKKRIRRHYTGEKNQHGQRYSVRNVQFEPYLDRNTDWATKALVEIKQAFQLNRPAIVCSHRINYVSGMCMKHRDRSLRMLDDLLLKARNSWGTLEFVTSNELLNLMAEDNDQ